MMNRINPWSSKDPVRPPTQIVCPNLEVPDDLQEEVVTYFSGLNIPRSSSKQKAAIESVTKSKKDVKGILRYGRVSPKNFFELSYPKLPALPLTESLTFTVVIIGFIKLHGDYCLRPLKKTVAQTKRLEPQRLA